jgi:cytochrome c oxidase subunit 3
VKLAEWQWNAAHGLTAGAGIFVVVYWYLTINHFIHASWACWAWAAPGAAGHRRLQRPEPARLAAMAIDWARHRSGLAMPFALGYASA